MRTKASMKRYLLGEASVEQRADLENRYLSDADLFEELTETENDLIDAYVRGGLSDGDRQAFEKQYLSSPRRRARVQFASALAAISREPRQGAPVATFSFRQWLTSPLIHSSSRLRWGLALATLVIVVGVGWWRTYDRGLQANLRQAAVRPNGTIPPRAVAPATNPPSQGTVKVGENEIAEAHPPKLDEFTVQLTAGVSRSPGSETKTVSLAQTRWINFQLALEDNAYSAYTAVVETAEGNRIQRIAGLRSHVAGGNTVVNLRVQSKLLSAGDYDIRLNGTDGIAAGETKANEEEVDVYTFRAVRK